MNTERLEGRISILAALRAGRRPFEAILVSRQARPEKIAEIVEEAGRRNVPMRAVEEAELGAQAKTHGGVVALCGPKPLMPAAELYRAIEKKRAPGFVLLLEGADDPRNVGYVLRTAEAFGVDAVLLRRRAWDLDGTAVSRASSGAFERIPIVLVERELAEVRELQRRKLRLVCCIPRARRALYEMDLKQPLILAIGGEKRGLSGAVRSEHDFLVRIPTKPESASLSMTQAAAVAVAEVARQRGSFA